MFSCLNLLLGCNTLRTESRKKAKGFGYFFVLIYYSENEGQEREAGEREIFFAHLLIPLSLRCVSLRISDRKRERGGSLFLTCCLYGLLEK